MKNHLQHFGIFAILLFCTSSLMAQFSNKQFHFSCPGGVTITYDLACDVENVTLWYSADMSHWVQAITVTGDTGTVTTASGNHKEIKWDNSADKVKNGNFYFKIKTTTAGCSCPGLTVNGLTFMCYNLGADPTYDTPKKQMQYLASSSGYGALTTALERNTDHTVFGNLYQWGRQANGNYEKRGSAAVAVSASVTYDSNGQINSAAHKNNFVTGIANIYDWRVTGSTTTSGSLCNVNNSCDTLWGNGKAITAITPGGVLFEGNTYQKPYKTVNDPCPLGWRIPTQDEWERLGNYDNNPTTAGGNFTHSGTYSTSTGLTWVAVRCGGGSCLAQNTGWATATPGGYAIYITSPWTSALTTGSDLLAPGTPEPLLFLPVAGCRHNFIGTITVVGTEGYYWSSSIYGTLAHNLYFSSGGVYPNATSSLRANGFPVRCVAQ